MPYTLTFGEIADRWKEAKRNVVKHSTFCAYAFILKNYLLPMFANQTDITEEAVQQFVFDKIASGLSHKSVHDIVAVLKAITKFGAKHRLCQSRDLEVVYPPSAAVRPLPVLTIQNHRKLMQSLTTTPTPQNIGVLLSLCCGLRIGEVCALRWDQVDMARRIISVRGTVGRIYNCEKGVTEHYASSPKTRNSVREIPISAPLLDALRKVRRQQVADIYVVGTGATPKEPRIYRETFSRMLRRLKIPPIVFHGLRHTFATRCIESGCDYKTVSVLLGHSNVATTLNLYVHPNLDQKKRCLDRMNKFLRLENHQE